ncbi:MAG: hypothetical protein ACR2ND_07405 [Solirubrobacteraceae bacterium]
MSTPPSSRSIKISDDERGGWSSDRPRPGGGPVRPINISGRCNVLRPSDRIRYSPGSLLLIACASHPERDRFADRLIEDRASLLSVGKVRGLLAGRVAAEEIEPRAEQLLHAAARQRLDAGETVVVLLETLAPQEREPFLRAAYAQRRPRHLMLLETAKDQVDEGDRAPLNELRRALDAGELGAEGIQTGLRLGGNTAAELKRILFRPAPREE